MKNAPETQMTLIVRLKAAEEAAWRDFVEIYEPAVYGLARKKGLQHADAIDVSQEVMLRVAGAVEKWEPDSKLGSFRGWLATITRNMTIQHLRSNGRRPRTADDSSVRDLLESREDDRSTEAEFERQQRQSTFAWAARRVRSQFAESTWEAFWRSTVKGESINDVARSIRLSRGAVYIARSRVIAALRTVVERADGQTTGPDNENGATDH